MAENGHGGARPGAGRKRSNESIVKDNETVLRRIRPLAEEGWGVLAESYPSLIRKAIELAMGGENSPPNIVMLKTLIEQLPKLAGSEPDTSKLPIHTILHTIYGDAARDAA